MRTACLLLLAGLATPLAGQHAAIDSLGAHARRLRAMAATAQAAYQAQQALLRHGPQDTVMVDPLMILVPGGMAAHATAGVRLAAERVREELGDAADLLRDAPLELAFGMGTVGTSGRIPVVGLPDSADAEAIAEAIMRWAGPLLSTRGGAALRAWAVVPVNVNRTDAFRFAYVELVTAAPGAATRCLTGGIADCTIALGLVTPDDPATAYWDAAGRREMVTRYDRPYSRNEMRVLADRCLAEGEDDGCISYLRLIADDPRRDATALAPTGTAPRQSLILTAMTLGGPGALNRLLTDSTRGPVASIEAAAGQPLGAVLERWLREMVAARPTAEVGAGSRVLAMIWAMVFAGLAAGGTRWRAG